MLDLIWTKKSLVTPTWINSRVPIESFPLIPSGVVQSSEISEEYKFRFLLYFYETRIFGIGKLLKNQDAQGNKICMRKHTACDPIKKNHHPDLKN